MVDVTATYPAKTIVLQDIADVKYIRLETLPKFMIDNTDVRYMDDEIVIFTNRQEDIMIFDSRTGKGVSSFNRKGRGSGEYVYVGPMTVDRERGEIFVRDANNLPVYVYDMHGKHIRTLDFKKNLDKMDFFHDWNDGHLFYYNSYSPQRPDEMPYRLVSKTDTVMTDLPLRLEGRDHMYVRHDFSNGSYMASSMDDVSLAKISDGYMISEPGLDTIFSWDRNTGALTPVMVRVPSFHSMEYPIGLFYMGESSGYMFLQTIERKMEFDGTFEDIMNGTQPRSFKKVNLVYDKNDGLFYEGKLVNGDFTDEREFSLSNNFGISAGWKTTVLQPYELLELQEAGKLRGKLAEVALTLKEDNNPVLMIVTFK